MTTSDFPIPDDLAARVRRRWDAAARPPLRCLLADGVAAADLARADQVEGWRRGAGPLVEDYLAEFPELRADRDGFLVLAYGELALRAEAGRPATPDDLRRRFPDRADDVARLWEVFAALAADGRDVPGYVVGRAVRRFAWGEDREAVSVGLRRPVLLRRVVPAVGADVSRFLALARHASKFDHPDLLPVLDADRAGRDVVVAAEWTDGPTLADGPLPAAAAARVAAAVGRAVAHVVSRGWPVRALPPENVMRTAAGPRYLCVPLELMGVAAADRAEPAELVLRLFAAAGGARPAARPATLAQVIADLDRLAGA